MTMIMMMMMMMMSHLIFDVKVSSGLAENLNNARETVPCCDVQTRLFVLRGFMMMMLLVTAKGC